MKKYLTYFLGTYKPNYTEKDITLQLTNNIDLLSCELIGELYEFEALNDKHALKIALPLIDNVENITHIEINTKAKYKYTKFDKEKYIKKYLQ